MGWFLGGLDGFLYALLMFVVIDYATGLMAAFVQKKVSSEVGFKGICKKVAIFCLVGIGHSKFCLLITDVSCAASCAVSCAEAPHMM